MSPELIIAIKERLVAGQTRAEIETAVLAMGHTKEVFDAAYTLAEHDVAKAKETALPKVTKLFVDGWNFAKTRFDLIVLLSIPLFIEVLASFWFGYDELGDEFPPAPLFAIFILLGLTYVVTLAMTLFVVTRTTPEEADLGSAVTWTMRHALPLLFVYLLSGLIIFGGFLFFLIPGFIVLVTVTFAQYAYLKEGKGGMAAILASRAVVKGRWFTVAFKIFGFILLSLIPMLLFGIAYGIIEGVFGEGEIVTLGGELLTQILSAVMSIINLYAMYHLYLALRDSKDVEAPTRSAKVRYWGLVAFALAFFAAIALAAIFYRESLSWIEEAAEPLEVATERTVPASFAQLDEAVLQYVNERNGSYYGVCEVLRATVTEEGEVTCNDRDTAWAIEWVDNTGSRFCADTATPGKEIATPLGQKTECIAI